MKPTTAKKDLADLMKTREALANITSSLSVLSPSLPRDVSQACSAALEVFTNLETKLIATKPIHDLMADHSDAKPKLREASDRVRACARKNLPFTKFKSILMKFIGHFRDTIADNEDLSEKATKIEDYLNVYCFLEEAQRLELQAAPPNNVSNISQPKRVMSDTVSSISQEMPSRVMSDGGVVQALPPVIKQGAPLQRVAGGSGSLAPRVHELKQRAAQFTSERKRVEENMQKDVANLRKEIGDLKEKIDRIRDDLLKKVDETHRQIVKEIEAVEQKTPKLEKMREFEKQMETVTKLDTQYQRLLRTSEEQAKKLREAEDMKQRHEAAERKMHALEGRNKQLEGQVRKLEREKSGLQKKQGEARVDDEKSRRLLDFIEKMFTNSVPSD